jgi:integrase
MVDAEPRKKRGKTRERGNGRGTVYELPDGRVRWQYRTAEGKVLASGICAKRGQAEDKLSETRTEFLRGTLATADRVTVRDYATKWLERLRHLRPSTRRMYAYELEYALTSPLGKMKLRDVRPVHIKTALDKLSNQTMHSGLGKGKQMSTRTLGMVRGRLRSVFADAVRDQIIYVNPTDSVRPIKPAHTSSESETGGVALDFHEAARLHELGEALYAAGSCRLWPAIFTALSVGLRRGEVMALRWQDVDLERAVLMVRKNLTLNNGELLLDKPKTAQSVRDIPIPSSLHTLLASHRQTMLAESASMGHALKGETPVFATALGTFTQPDNLGTVLSNIIQWSNPAPLERKVRARGKSRATPGERKLVTLEQRMKSIPVNHRAQLEAVIFAGDPLPKISPHDLRHTAGTLMLRRGMPVEVVSRILGHAKVSITLDVYRHVLESEKRAVMVDLFPNPVPTRNAVALPMN